MRDIGIRSNRHAKATTVDNREVSGKRACLASASSAFCLVAVCHVVGFGPSDVGVLAKKIFTQVAPAANLPESKNEAPRLIAR